MSSPTRIFRFGWWNLHNYAHYDRNRVSDPRWPKSVAEFDAKRERVLTGMREVFGSAWPELLAVCEITRPAAHRLQADLPAGYELATSPEYPHDDGFQVAVFFRTGVGLTHELPLLPVDLEDVSEGTRPMLALHLSLPGHVIRFIACHWTGMDLDTSRLARERLADILRRDCHEFLEPNVPISGVARHMVVIGDLNEEPPARLFDRRLEGYRDRASSHIRHGSYAQTRRVRLYNAAWRFLGEQTPHTGGTPPARVIAGTYFDPPDKWRTFDHILVSRGLLNSMAPYLDEGGTHILSADILVDDRGRPTPFVVGNARGVSDHLPVVGRLVLPGGQA